MKHLLKVFLFALPLLFCQHSYSQIKSEEEALIQGFAKWQAGRIEKIILDEALTGIANDPYVERFFSQTSSNIKFYDKISAKRLIPLMQHYIKEDINHFNALIESCIPYNVNSWFDENISIEQKAENVEKLYTSLKKLSSIPNEDDDPFTTTSFSDELGCDEDILKAPVDFVEISKEDISDIASKLYNQLKQINDKADEKESSLPDTVEGFISSEKYIKVLISTFVSYQKVFDDTESFSIRTHQMLLALEQFGGISSKDYLGFSGLKSTSLFFAGLADAADTKDPNAVAAALDSFVDERDTFVRKRLDQSYYSIVTVTEFDSDKDIIDTKQYRVTCNPYKILPCRNTLFVSSYYGVSYGNIAQNSTEPKNWNFRAFGPVGIELKLATFKSAPLTLNLAPIDIGNYITNELKGDEEYSANFKDILAPSAFLSYSLKSKPVSFLAGYQKDIRVGENFKTSGPFVAIAFDLPIFTIY